MRSNPRRRAPVITDVARVAGVSVPTVSRVLNGSLPVSAQKRAQVLRAIDELGYRPNGAAQALVTGRRSLISVITSNTTRYGYAMTLQGIEEAARAAGYLVAISVLDDAAPRRLDHAAPRRLDHAAPRRAGTNGAVTTAVDLALGQQVAGAVVLDFDEAAGRAVADFPDTVPLAAVTSSTTGRVMPRVIFDDQRGGADATRYLLGLGHRTVHHVALPEPGRPNGRTLGWRAALQEAGAEVPDLLETDWSVASGLRAGRELAARPEVTAVLCGNDEVAFAVMKALQEAGRAVPDDVSVMGFDDHPHAALWSPPLTTMSQDFPELGRRAVALLLAHVEEAHAEERTAPEATADAALHLVVRASTAPPRR